jgi:hypothetical protein
MQPQPSGQTDPQCAGVTLDTTCTYGEVTCVCEIPGGSQTRRWNCE